MHSRQHISRATSQHKRKVSFRGPPDKKGSPNRVTKDLPYQAEIAIGMRVMVKENVETDLDITNGTCGEIVGIVLHEDKPPIAQGAVVKLRYLPAYILVKLSRTKASKLAGLVNHISDENDSKGRKEGTTQFEDANFPSQQLMLSRIIVLKVRPLPMYWSTLLLHQGVHLVSSTFMLSYQEVPEGIQFACSVILTMTCSGNLMTQHCCKKLSDWRKWIRKQRLGIWVWLCCCRVGHR